MCLTTLGKGPYRERKCFSVPYVSFGLECREHLYLKDFQWSKEKKSPRDFRTRLLLERDSDTKQTGISIRYRRCRVFLVMLSDNQNNNLSLSVANTSTHDKVQMPRVFILQPVTPLPAAALSLNTGNQCSHESLRHKPWENRVQAKKY